jgi:hypothetical protein
VQLLLPQFGCTCARTPGATGIGPTEFLGPAFCSSPLSFAPRDAWRFSQQTVLASRSRAPSLPRSRDGGTDLLGCFVGEAHRTRSSSSPSLRSLASWAPEALSRRTVIWTIPLPILPPGPSSCMQVVTTVPAGARRPFHRLAARGIPPGHRPTQSPVNAASPGTEPTNPVKRSEPPYRRRSCCCCRDGANLLGCRCAAHSPQVPRT